MRRRRRRVMTDKGTSRRSGSQSMSARAAGAAQRAAGIGVEREIVAGRERLDVPRGAGRSWPRCPRRAPAAASARRTPRSAHALLQRVAQRAVGRDAADHREHVAPVASSAPHRPDRRAARRSRADSSRRGPRAAPRGPLAELPHAQEQRGLEAREREVEAGPPRARAGTGRRAGSPSRASASSAGPPGCGRPSRRAPLSKASPAASSSVPPSTARLPCAGTSSSSVCPPEASRHAERRLEPAPGRAGARRRGRAGGRRARTAAGARRRRALPRREADEQRADQPGALGRGDQRRRRRATPRPRPAPRDDRARRARGDAARRSRARRRRSAACSSPARSGPTSTAPSRETTAAQVSSHDVSSARITLGARPRLASPPGPPHDQGVLAVVGVVAAAHARGVKPIALVEPDGLGVRDPHLEREAAGVVVCSLAEDVVEQELRDALAPLLGVDRHVHHMPGVDVPGHDQIAGQRSSMNAPKQRLVAFTSSPANMERDHGVG